MEKVHIKPAPGKKVRKPDTKLHLAEAGEFVEKSPYWKRRIQEGDVLLIEETKEEIKNPVKQNLKGDK